MPPKKKRKKVPSPDPDPGPGPGPDPDPDLAEALFSYLSGEKRSGEARKVGGKEEIPDTTFRRKADAVVKEISGGAFKKATQWIIFNRNASHEQIKQGIASVVTEPPRDKNATPLTNREKYEAFKERELQKKQEMYTSTQGGATTHVQISKTPGDKYRSIAFLRSKKMCGFATKYNDYLLTLEPKMKKEMYVDGGSDPKGIPVTEYSKWFFAEKSMKEEVLDGLPQTKNFVVLETVKWASPSNPMYRFVAF